MNISAIDALTGAQTNNTYQSAQQNSTSLPSAPSAPASSTESQSSESTQNEIKTYAGQGMTAAQIALELGIPLATVEQLAQAAGITLSSGNSPSASQNPAIGSIINVSV
jgi:DNA-binding NarL/FixJ family response regulator